MSTIAAKFSSATTQLKVGTAAVAVAAAAVVTPAVAEATPAFAPAVQALGSSISTEEIVVIPGGLNATVDAGASGITGFEPFDLVYNAVVVPIGGWFYGVVITVADTIGGPIGAVITNVANGIAATLRVGPYAE